AGRSKAAGKSGSSGVRRHVPPRRRPGGLLLQIEAESRAARPRRHHRLHLGLGDRSAAACAHRARAGEEGVRARRLQARRRARLPTEPVLPGLRARALKAWLRFAAEGLLVAFLALHAPQRSRKRLQTLENDVAAAVDADAVAALLDALTRRLQSPELIQVTRQVGLLQIGEQRGDRFVARVGCRPGVLGIGLLARTRRILA